MAEEESNPRFSKQARIYVGGTFGLICLIFILLIITEKLSDQSVESGEQQTTTTQISDTEQPTDVSSDTFQHVRDQRALAKDVADTPPSKKQSTAGLQTFTEKVKPDVLKQEENRMVALEYKRAAMAARSSWGLKEKTPSKTAAIVQTAQPISSGSIPAKTSNDEQRKMIAKRLQDVAILKQQIKSGNYSAFESKSKQQQLSSLEDSFSPAPPEIVGYTEENQYNASTEGLFKVPIGTIIPAITMTKANSDLTGTFKGLVSQDIFDVTGEYVLIPKGSDVILKSMSLNAKNEAINPRVGTVVPWIILPNGNKIDLSTATGLDREGLVGLSDQVDRHLMEQFLGVAAYALVANETSYEGTGANSDSSYGSEVSQGVRDQLSPMAKKYLSLTATNEIRTGQSMNVIVEEEVYLKPWRHIYEDYL